MKNNYTHLRMLGIVLTLLLFCCSANSQSHKIRVAMMGNSITYGSGLDNPSEECYPSQLSSMLAGVYGDTIEIMNYGVSGRTMMRSAEYPLWNETQFPSALKYVPDICLIFLGTNDSQPYRWDTWGDEYLDDYIAMIDTFKFRNPHTKFIVCYPPPIWEGHPYGTNFSDSHNDSIVVNYVMPAIDTVVQETGAMLIDFHTPFVDSLHLFPDKLHPNTVGAKYLADILYDSIVNTGFLADIEAGKAFISTFEPAGLYNPEGAITELKWTTLFADSVFLDGVAVDINGKSEIVANNTTTYILTAKNAKNTSSFPLKINTYIQEKTRMSILSSSSSYQNGKEVTLSVSFKDQHNKVMNTTDNNIVWELVEGEGQFGIQTDNEISFTPGAIRKIVIKASEGEISKQKTIYSNIEPYLAVEAETIDNGVKVYPNPANEVVSFQLKEASNDKVEIQIFDIMGKLLISRSYESIAQDTHVSVNIGSLSEGIYVYAIEKDGKKVSGQFKKAAGNDIK